MSQVNGDTKFEADEDFTVTLNSANNATINPAGDTVTGVIENDDAMPTISISPPTISQPEGDSGTTLYIYTVTLSNASDQTITVDYSTNDGSATLADNDYQDNDGSLTFNPGDPLTQQIIVEVNGDTDVENDEDFTVTLDSATNANIDASADTSTGIIANDDTPPPVSQVSISPTTINQPEGDSGTTLYTYTVTLSNASDQIVTVDYTTNDGSATLADNDYQDNDGILTFNPGEPLTQQIVVAVNGDTDVENDEDFTVTLNGATNANIDASADTSTGIIINDDTLPPIPQVSIGSPTISQAEGDSGTTLYTYTVTLSNANDQIITVDYTTNDGSATLADNDYQDNDGSLTFNPGDELTQEITVAVNGDTQLEGDETFTVRLDLVEGGEVELNPNARESRGIIVNDEPRPKKGVSWGDPHIITFDGLHYEFQTVGDFVLVESDSEDWEIQVRQEPFRGRRQVSSNTAVATLVDGVNVGIYLGQDLPVEIDGTPTSIDNGGFLTVGNSLITRNNNTYSIIFAGEDEIATIEDDRLDTTLFSGHMLVEVFLSNERMGLVQGLLGDGDMDRSNDFAFRNGAVLAQPVPFSQRYGEFADSWRVGEGESLFRDTLTDDPDFPVGGEVTVEDLRQLDPDKVALAEQMLREAGIFSGPEFDAAIIDLFFSDCDPSFIEAVVEAIEPFGDLTAIWTGNGDGVSYSDPENWHINTVPRNTDDARFTVIIPTGFSNPTNDFSGDAFDISRFDLDNDGRLRLSSDSSLTVLEEADIAGIISAEGGDFFATVNAEFVGDRVRLSAVDGSVVAIAAPTYSSSGLGFSATLMSVDGENTLLDLSSVTSLDISFDDGDSFRTRTHTITATNGGTD